MHAGRRRLHGGPGPPARRRGRGQAAGGAPAPGIDTFIALARRFDDVALADLDDAVGALVATAFAAYPKARRSKLAAVRPTIDLDPTDIETYGPKKEGMAYNYQGQRVGRAHPAVWAEAGLVLAAELGSGRSDPRPRHRR